MGMSAALLLPGAEGSGALPHAAALLGRPVRLASIAEEDTLQKAAFLHPQLV